MDFIDGLPSLEGYEVIFLVVDRLTKYNHFVGLKHPSAKTVARTFNDNVVKLHGYPEIFISGRDTIFSSDFWQELFTLQGFSLRLSTSYHPQTDGQTKVVNRCLETYLHCVTGDQPKNWHRWLSIVEWWYNSNYHTAIHTSLFEALYGYPPLIHLPCLPESARVHEVDVQLQSREEMLKLL